MASTAARVRVSGSGRDGCRSAASQSYRSARGGPRPSWSTVTDLVRREFHREGPNQLWVTDIERHEALSNRVGVGDLDRRAVAAAWL